MAEAIEGLMELRPESGAGRVIALYLDLAREVDFWRSAEDGEREYAAVDRSTADHIGQACAWFLRASGEVVVTAIDWELSPLDHQDGLMERISTERAFHDAPALFSTVWEDRLERLERENT